MDERFDSSIGVCESYSSTFEMVYLLISCRDLSEHFVAADFRVHRALTLFHGFLPMKLSHDLRTQRFLLGLSFHIHRLLCTAPKGLKRKSRKQK